MKAALSVKLALPILALLFQSSLNGGGLKVIGQIHQSCTSSPAVSTQATCSIAADAARRHVADCVGFSAGSTTAPALTQLKVTLRDGATGAGTILWQKVVVVTAAAAQNIGPHTVCGLHIPGSLNTAMTLEFNAALTSLFEEVSLTTYDISSQN